jgi:dTDP-glucose 4,6-dehydratase
MESDTSIEGYTGTIREVHILVTGGAGFIGSEFVRMTLRDHPADSVVVLDKLTYAGNLRNLESVRDDSRLRFVQGDIADARVVEELVAACDAIVNFAAETHVDRSLEEPGRFIVTDVYGTWVLLDAAVRTRCERFVHVSTDEVYGHVPQGRSREDDPLRPRSPYSASKAGGEMMVQAYRATHGYPALVTRGSNTYGPYQYPEKIIPLFITNAIDGLALPIYGDGAAVRDYIHVEDHALGIDAILRGGEPGADYNIGQGGEEVDGVRVADTVLRLLDAEPALKTFVQDRPGHDRRYALDCSRLRALGWAPRWDFETGMADTVRWYRERGDWWRPLKSGEFWDFYRRNYRPLAGGTQVGGL